MAARGVLRSAAAWLLPLLLLLGSDAAAGDGDGGDWARRMGRLCYYGEPLCSSMEEGAALVLAPAPKAMADSPAQFCNQSRLPRFAAPRRYELRLRPDLIGCTFSGSTSISLVVSAPTRFLVLNAADLAVDRASIRFKDLAPSGVTLFAADQIMVLGFDQELPIGEGVLKMNFNGTLNDQMRGFYRSKYEYKGETRNMAVTQFEAVDARRCFPCWDEPAFKAKFKLTLEVPSELVALSNMPVAKETVAGSIKTVYYEESPLMSTYLVAIVVGLFDYVEGATSQGNKVRVYTQVGKSNEGKFALDVGVKSLNFYRDYFNTPYPLPKLDMVAIPDFSAGAMENYGLVTYREASLLFDERSTSASTKQNVAITVAHELAHQWFGNLVTMEWWTHLWLNEGFATWMSNLAVDVFFPQWNIWTQFLDSTTSALKLDSLAESHPIEVEIKHADEVDAVFDDITYDKGASLIRMLQDYLGAQRFQKALASYIKKYAYSNAKTEDLWAVLEKESGEPVKDLMTTWTKQKGYPVITAKHKGNDLELEQDQFMLDGSSGPGFWIVPITSGCGSRDTQKRFLLKNKRDKMDIKGITSRCDGPKGGKNWIKLNINVTGFYRVKYDDELAAALQNALLANKLSPMDKIGIVDDAHALSIACKKTLASLLNLLYAYRGEGDYSVLSHINSVSASVAKISVDATPNLLGDIKKVLIKLFLLPAGKLGWDPKANENHLDAMLRPLLLDALVQLGHDKTINEGIRRFRIFLNDRNTSLLRPDTRKVAYLSVMQNVSSSNRSGYDALLKVYRESTEVEEKIHILGTISSCKDQAIVLESLNLIFTNQIRNQDASHVLRGITIDGRETAWSWLKENWDRISKTFSTSSLISDFIKYTVPLFASNNKAAEISAFFATRTKPSFERTLKQSLETVRINARWVEGIKREPDLAQTVAIIVTHELAHQWFGNLVTMDWWTNLWLNEGFATWVSHLALDSLFPEWNFWTQFLESTTSALKLDSLAQSHPIEVEIHKAEEAAGIFDEISYSKGAAVIRMVQTYLGANCFQKALGSYIKKYTYSNAKTEDLWAVLEEVSGEPIKELMNLWTKQQGYPVINAKLNGHNVEVEQEQFLLDGSSGPGFWIVPITSGCGSNDTQKRFLLKTKSGKMDIKDIASLCEGQQKGGKIWIKLNTDETGFYRVKYDDELSAGLLNVLQSNKLSLMDKIGVLDDAHALSIACKKTMASLLNLLHAFREEGDFSVLSQINTVSLSVAKISFDATPDLVADINRLLIKILLPPAEKLSWDPKNNESHMTKMLRPLLLGALVELGHDKTIKEGVRRFHVFLDDRNTSLLPPDTRKVAYLSVMQTVSSKDRSGYDALLKVYRESTEAEEKLRILGTITSCKDKDIVLESLNLIFTDEVRNQDAYLLLKDIQVAARETVWSWLQENWDRISKTFSTSNLISKFVKYIVTLFASNDKAAEISKFFATRTDPAFERMLKQSLETVRINARWIDGIKSERELAKTVRELLGKP